MGLTIDDINHRSDSQFVELLGSIFEHSPWVAELVIPIRPFDCREELHRSMTHAVRQAPVVQRMELLCRHPELAGKEASAGTLTQDSRREQAGAGLNQCSTQELEKIASLNLAYREKFHFPFIIAVTGLNKYQILDAMEQRLANNEDVEFDTAIGEVEKIARIRINALIDA
jgi:2-oxo-4-hydroxy-4-carboxy-5-ureidoimidazoline decarboxylase